MKIELQRIKVDQNQSSGIFTVFNNNGYPVFSCVCLERGDRNNQRNISNIPQGIYDIVYEWSPKFNMFLWELKGVIGRTEVKIHIANYYYQLQGCIALGAYLTDFNKDGYLDVAASRRTLKDFHRVMDGFNQITGGDTIQIIDPIEITPF